jgi:hypothetical protein
MPMAEICLYRIKLIYSTALACFDFVVGDIYVHIKFYIWNRSAVFFGLSTVSIGLRSKAEICVVCPCTPYK